MVYVVSFAVFFGVLILLTASAIGAAYLAQELRDYIQKKW